jgi:hypothetical protein
MEPLDIVSIKENRKYKRLPLNNEGKLLNLGNIRIKSPQNLVIISYPKSGKTLSMVNVPKILIIDVEKGTDYFDANNKATLFDETVEGTFELTKKYGYIPKTIYDLISELYIANNMKNYWEKRAIFDSERDLVAKQQEYEELLRIINEMPFPIVVIDTIPSLIDISNNAALFEYNKAMKPDHQKADIKRVDEYGGVNFIRRKFTEIKNFIEQNAAPFIVYNGHIALNKKKLKKEDDEISVLDIALEGVLSTIFTIRADSVATFYRNEKGAYLDFLKKDETALGTRASHLSNKLIKIADIIKPGETQPVTYWAEIFPEINFKK